MSNRPTIPSDWEWTSIDKLAAPVDYAIVDGPFGSNLKVSDYVEFGVPVLQGSNITGNEFKMSDLRFVTRAKAQKLRRSFVRVGDLLVVKIGTIGYAAIIDDLGQFDEALIPANLLKATLNNKKVDNRFVLHFLTSEFGYRALTNLIGKTAQPALSLGKFRKLEIPLPSLHEQQRISKILDTADAVIQQTEAVIEKLKMIKQGLLHDLLTRGLNETGKLRDPEAHPEQFKYVEGYGRVPQRWNVFTLAEITLENRPICYGIVQVGQYSESGVPVIAIKNLGGDYSTEVHRSAKEIERNYVRSRIQPMDLLISVKGTVGRVDVVPDGFFGNISRDVARLRLRGMYSPIFLKHLLSSSFAQKNLKLAVVGTTRMELSIGRLKDVPLVIPCFQEQLKIENILEAHDSRIRTEEAYRDKLKQIKRGLIYDLLTGEVRV